MKPETNKLNVGKKQWIAIVVIAAVGIGLGSAILGGKKGAVIGGAIGGGAGTAVVLSTEGQDVVIPAGTVLDKLKAGANLVQFYTGMVYEGPGLPARILADLPKLLARDGAASISDLVGRDVEAWAAGGPAA